MGKHLGELSGLELRKAACEALGWDVIEDMFLENETQRINGIGRPPGSATTEILPRIESDPAVSEPMFMDFCATHGWDWGLSRIDNAFNCVIIDKSKEDFPEADGDTPSEARARAIAEATHE